MTLYEYNQNESLGSDSEANSRPMIHPCSDSPLCENCLQLELTFFDVNCASCNDILESPCTTVSEIFAILRQWTPQTQQSLQIFIDEILHRGAHINDRDGLTDMTMLHYASKAGADGMCDPDMASEVVSMLLARGADSNLHCRWTDMAALHYAAFFNVVPVVKVLLKASRTLDIDSTCSEFDHATALHIATANLGYETVKVLLQNGANSQLEDDMGRTALACVPDTKSFEPDSSAASICGKLIKILTDSLPASPKKSPPNYDLVQSKVTLQAMGLSIGDSVIVGGCKSGTLRYCGPTEFASGIWVGIELDESVGKNDGSIGGISYFHCPKNYGIFAPVRKISKPDSMSPTKVNSSTITLRSPSKAFESPVRVTHVTARVDTGLSKSRASSVSSDISDVRVGDTVVVAGQRKGTVRYVGETQFAPGLWYGIELNRPVGKNDGSVKGIRYFSCRSKCGVFAPPSRITKLGDKRYTSNESLDTISWGAVSERINRKMSGSTLTNGSSPGMKAKSPSKSPIKGAGKPIVRTPGAESSLRLEEGTSVFCSGELGVIRYIGPTEFADGVWIGVELRTPKGKNDGSVRDRRYFTCKPDHGLLVRPNKVTVRGISGAKLMRDYYMPDPRYNNNPEVTSFSNGV